MGANEGKLLQSCTVYNEKQKIERLGELVHLFCLERNPIYYKLQQLV